MEHKGYRIRTNFYTPCYRFRAPTTVEAFAINKCWFHMSPFPSFQETVGLTSPYGTIGSIQACRYKVSWGRFFFYSWDRRAKHCYGTADWTRSRRGSLRSRQESIARYRLANLAFNLVKGRKTYTLVSAQAAWRCHIFFNDPDLMNPPHVHDGFQE